MAVLNETDLYVSFVEVTKNSSPEGVDLAYVTVGGDVENGGGKVCHGSGGIVPLLAE